MKILLAVDDSASSEAAISRLIGQMKAQNTEVHLLHVLDLYPGGLAKRTGGQDSLDFIAARMKQRTLAAEMLARDSEHLRSAGFSVSSSIKEGDVRPAILEEAVAWRADLVVLGSREPKAKGLRRFFSRSISEDVARNARCSVEIFRLWPRLTIIPDEWSGETSRKLPGLTREV